MRRSLFGADAAGLSAALVLGRARRQTVVIDANEQSNRASGVIGGLLGYDQRSPAELYAAGRKGLLAYPTVVYRRKQVTGGRRVDNGFVLEVEGGEPIHARRVLLDRNAVLPAGDTGAGGAVGLIGVSVPVLPWLGDAGKEAGIARRRRIGRAFDADAAGLDG